MLAAIEAGVRPVSGTSNLPEEALLAVDTAARERGIAAVWAPHYRLAGVLLTHLSQIAAQYLDSVELVEAHHATKADAPSGYAQEFARRLSHAHGGDLHDVQTPLVTVDGVRGGVVNGVRIHSLRLPGIVGWHEAIFAGDQELLTIRHDDLGREAYVPAVANAIRFVTSTDRTGLIRGYGAVLGLPDVGPVSNR
jgi:4-hydroxy-tetrahydrodipicolinate reductase